MENVSLETTVPDVETTSKIMACGNCGKFILPKQQRLDVYNTRHKRFEYYHESYLGCYESSQNVRPRIIMNRFKPWLNIHDTYIETVEPYTLGYET